MPVPLNCRMVTTYESDGGTTDIAFGGHDPVTVPAGGTAQVTLPIPASYGDPARFVLVGPKTSLQVWMLVTVEGAGNAPSNFGVYPSIAGNFVVQSPITINGPQITITYLNSGAAPATYSLQNLYPTFTATTRRAVVTEVCTGVPGHPDRDPGPHVRLYRRRGPVTNAWPAGAVGDRVDITYPSLGWSAYPFLVTRVTLRRPRNKHHVKVLDLDKVPGVAAGGSSGGTALYVTVGTTAGKGIGARIAPG